MGKIGHSESMEPKFLEKVDLSEVYLTRLQPREDLFIGITELCKKNNINSAVILSAIGSLCDVSFRDLEKGIELPVDANKTNLIETHGPFELLTLDGSIFPLVGQFGGLKDGDLVLHFHCTLGTSEGNIIGGHLFRASVFTTTEIFLAKIKNTKVKKKQSVITGLTEMRADI